MKRTYVAIGIFLFIILMGYFIFKGSDILAEKPQYNNAVKNREFLRMEEARPAEQ